jgi:uncharacterized membrane protein
MASIVAIAVFSGAITSAGATQYEVRLVQETDRLPFTAPLGMNEGGTIVGYGGPEAYSPFSVPVQVDPSGALTVLSIDEPNFGFAHGIDRTGATIVGEYGWRPHVWTGGTRAPLPVPAGYFSGVARDVSERGVIVGTFADYDDPIPPNPVGPRPCFWPGPGGPAVPMRVLAPRNPTGLAFDINEQGQVAGSVASRRGFVAVRWSSPQLHPRNLGHLPGAILSEARAINEAGDVAGRSGFADGTSRAFIGRAGGRALTPLPSLPADFQYAEAFDLDDLGNVVGFSRVAEGVIHAVLWLNREWAGHEVIDLNDRLAAPHPAVRHLSSAVAITNQGVIAAEAVLESAAGDEERAIAILSPAMAADEP